MKHRKQRPALFNLRRDYEIPLLIRCQKHLRHKNREHQHNAIRWTSTSYTF